MQLAHYEIKSEETFTVFEFTSTGNKGEITKLIIFSKTNKRGVYNLAFGDKIKKSDEIDDLTISNNGDSLKVLATVVVALYIFTEKHKNCWVYIEGSTKARNRLYRMGISKYFPLVKLDFFIMGLYGEVWYEFEKYINYDAFIVRRK
jgi:hypothetical protein